MKVRDLFILHYRKHFLQSLKISFFFAHLFFSFPLIAIQIWKFIAPGLYRTEKKAFLPFLIATPILFFAGGAMVYYLIAPLAWNFFLSYQNMSDTRRSHKIGS